MPTVTYDFPEDNSKKSLEAKQKSNSHPTRMVVSNPNGTLTTYTLYSGDTVEMAILESTETS